MKFVKFDIDTTIVFVVEKPFSLPATLKECQNFMKETGVKEVELNYGDYLIYIDVDSDIKRIINDYDFYLSLNENSCKHQSVNNQL